MKLPKMEVPIQTAACYREKQAALCALDLERVTAPTTGLLHQQSRFLFILEGEATLLIQSKSVHLVPGVMVAILPWQYTEIIAVHSPLKYYLLVYKFSVYNHIVKTVLNVLNEPIDLIHLLADTHAVLLTRKYRQRVEAIFQHLTDELGLGFLEPVANEMQYFAETNTKEYDLSSIYQLAYISEIVVSFCRCANAVADEKEEKVVLKEKVAKDEQISMQAANALASVGREVDEGIHQRIELFHYIFLHLQERPTLTQLADVFYMSESGISKYIENETGMSYSELLAEMRIARTIHLLLYTNLTLEEVANVLGYSDAAHVSRVFNRRVGIPTKLYREMFGVGKEISKYRSNRLYTEVIAFIVSSYNTDLTAEKVAAEFSLSVPELNQLLKYQVEKTFEEFVHYIRINHSCYLLLKSGKSIVDIAYEVGYKNVRTFMRNFFKVKEMTPGEFRKHYILQNRYL